MIIFSKNSIKKWICGKLSWMKFDRKRKSKRKRKVNGDQIFVLKLKGMAALQIYDHNFDNYYTKFIKYTSHTFTK